MQTKPASFTLSRVDAPTGEIRREPECNSLKGPIVNKLSRGEDRPGVLSRRGFVRTKFPPRCPYPLYPRVILWTLSNHVSRQFINPPTAEVEARHMKETAEVRLSSRTRRTLLRIVVDVIKNSIHYPSHPYF